MRFSLPVATMPIESKRLRKRDRCLMVIMVNCRHFGTRGSEWIKISRCCRSCPRMRTLCRFFGRTRSGAWQDSFLWQCPSSCDLHNWWCCDPCDRPCSWALFVLSRHHFRASPGRQHDLPHGQAPPGGEATPPDHRWLGATIHFRPALAFGLIRG